MIKHQWNHIFCGALFKQVLISVSKEERHAILDIPCRRHNNATGYAQCMKRIANSFHLSPSIYFYHQSWSTNTNNNIYKTSEYLTVEQSAHALCFRSHICLFNCVNNLKGKQIKNPQTDQIIAPAALFNDALQNNNFRTISNISIIIIITITMMMMLLMGMVTQ